MNTNPEHINDRTSDDRPAEAPWSIDERLTAYALGELDADDRAAVEAHLAEHPEARTTVESIRSVAGLLERDLEGAPAASLTDAQRDQVMTGAADDPPPPTYSFASFASRRTIGFAAAAALTLVAGAGILLVPSMAGREPAIGFAKNETDDAVSAPGPAPAAEGRRSMMDPAARPAPQEAGPVRGGRASGEGGSGKAVTGRPTSTIEGRRESETMAYDELASVEPSRRARDGAEAAAAAPMALPSMAPPPPPVADPAGGGQPGITASGDVVDAKQDFSREQYDRIEDNPFLDPAESQETRLSTFSIDVDTASYANVRRFLRGGSLPPADAVRIEEMVNYFSYADLPPSPDSDRPFAVSTEITTCPWTPEHRLVRIGLKGKVIDDADRPPSNLVFLLDVSGSMNRANKLPLLKDAMGLLVEQLDERDRVSIVVYAGAAGVVLEPTRGDDAATIMDALDRLRAGGSTNGGAGIELAYRLAREQFVEGGVNRVILATDGDFNVGVSDDGSLERLIEQKRESGVFLSILGFGSGNYQDAKMEKLSNAGNGNAFYIDSQREARKVLVEEIGGTLVTIAKDVKIQVDFNPAKVRAYRLIGYENRMLAARDFLDDTKDAGEIGAGHSVTALYEIVPVGVEPPAAVPPVEPSTYDDADADAEPAGRDVPEAAKASPELLTVRLRSKQPDAEESTGFEVPVVDEGLDLADASADLRFAASISGFGMILRDSPHKGKATLPFMIELAGQSIRDLDRPGDDPEHGHRREAVELMERARELLGDG